MTKKTLIAGICMMAAAIATASTQSPFRFAPRHSSELRKMEVKKPGRPMKAATVTEPDFTLPASSLTGYLDAPDGSTWYYTADLDVELEEMYEGVVYQENIKGINAKVYDGSGALAGVINYTFPMLPDAIRINYCEIATSITSKFFNYDAAPEVMVMVNYNFEDYHTEQVTHVFSLKGEEDATEVQTLEGYYVNLVDMASDPWSENYYMVFIQPATEAGYNYSLNLYSKAGYGEGCKSIFQTNVDDMLMQGTGDEGFPFLLARDGNELYFAIGGFEKNYFTNPYDFEDDSINPDNFYTITLYHAAYTGVEKVSTTRIPVQTAPEDCAFKVPALGMFQGNGDLSFGVYTPKGTAAFAITDQNISANFNDEDLTITVYDVAGNPVRTLASKVQGYVRMSDIEGQEEQYVFLRSDEEGYQTLEFTNLPSAEVTGTMSRGTEMENVISLDMDRVAWGESYKYAIGYAYGETMPNGNTYHRIGWFDEDLQLLELDRVNLGKDVLNALANLVQPVLNPYLIDTDVPREYLFLVQRANGGETTRSHTELLAKNSAGEEKIHIVFPDYSDRVMALVANTETEPTLFYVANNEEGAYVPAFISLPVAAFSAGGDGSADNPWLISSPGDFTQIRLHPENHYRVACDIDFGRLPFEPVKGQFTGSLDGADHKLKGLVLNTSSSSVGLFEDLSIESRVSNLVFEQPLLVFNVNTENAGFLSGNAMMAKISNIHLDTPTMVATASQSWCAVGSVVGMAAIETTLEKCSVTSASIRLPGVSNVGGIVGETRTGVNVLASCFGGELTARDCVGGIVGTADAKGEVTNCHVNADINASHTVGGVIGSSARKPVANCFVEGSISASQPMAVGGVVGALAPDYTGECKTPVVKGNVVALSRMDVEPSATTHRIVGSSANNEEGLHEEWLADNYAFSTLPVLDSEIQASDIDTEGADIEPAGADSAFYTGIGFKFGTSVDAPWAMDEATRRPILWYEPTLSGIVAVNHTATPAICYNGTTVTAPGAIEIYDISGNCVMRGRDTLTLSHLLPGIYVVRTATAALKLLR